MSQVKPPADVVEKLSKATKRSEAMPLYAAIRHNFERTMHDRVVSYTKHRLESVLKSQMKGAAISVLPSPGPDLFVSPRSSFVLSENKTKIVQSGAFLPRYIDSKHTTAEEWTLMHPGASSLSERLRYLEGADDEEDDDDEGRGGEEDTEASSEPGRRQKEGHRHTHDHGHGLGDGHMAVSTLSLSDDTRLDHHDHRRRHSGSRSRSRSHSHGHTHTHTPGRRRLSPSSSGVDGKHSLSDSLKSDDAVM
jgi:hypothetical protein